MTKYRIQKGSSFVSLMFGEKYNTYRLEKKRLFGWDRIYTKTCQSDEEAINFMVDYLRRTVEAEVTIATIEV